VDDQCNKSYQRDEDYFVTALMPHARGSYAGSAIYKRALERYRGGGKVGLVRKVLADFDPRPSGLVLPGNQVLQRLDGNRIKPRGDLELFKNRKEFLICFWLNFSRARLRRS
jgi:hypothetical protein